MEMDEYRLHVVASELREIIHHLTKTRQELMKAVVHIKTIGSTLSVPQLQAIEQNIDALMEGMLETVSMAALAKEVTEQQMTEPLADPLKRLGSLQIRATPFQKALMREGYTFPSTLPRYVPTKREARLPRIVPFTLAARERSHKRRDSKTNIPL
jgi:hypothetical protein